MCWVRMLLLVRRADTASVIGAALLKRVRLWTSATGATRPTWTAGQAGQDVPGDPLHGLGRAATPRAWGRGWRGSSAAPWTPADPRAGWVTRLTDRTYGQEWESADEDGRRKLMLNAGMRLKIMDGGHFVLTIPTATMRAGYPGWEPHLSPDDVAYIAGTMRRRWISSSPTT
jgi:hypothetical protein